VTRVFRLLAAVTAFAALAASAATSSSAVVAAGGPVTCAAADSTIIAQSSGAQVYKLDSTAYGCTGHSGQSYKLGSTSFCLGSPLAQPFALAGTVVAYGLETCGIDTSSAVVVVERLTTGLVLHSDAMTSTGLVEQHGSPAAVVVKPNGSDAWVGVERSITGQRLIQVYRHDSRGLVLLDSGPAVHPSSLTLRGSRLTWRHGSHKRHATLR
jgi:hypothetical protein